MSKFWGFLRFCFSTLAYLYATAVILWFVFHLIFNDRWGWLFLLNTGAIYLVLGVPLWGLRPLISKTRRDLFIYIALLAILITRFGPLLTPHLNAKQPTTQITVMTTNLLGSNINIDGIEQALRESDADVIGIQELSPQMAGMLKNNLLDTYPYQLLDPQVGVTGMGLISRYPIEAQPLPWADLFWVGTPQIIRVTVANTAVDIINFHAIPPIGEPLPDTRAIRIRETQAKFLAEYNENSPIPVILLGDLNATDQSKAHTIISEQMQDSWHAGGTGLGNTWPGFRSTKAGRLRLPSWLVRIDHIFVSEEIRVIKTEIGPWDGGADHRPVIATLGLSRRVQATSN